MFAQPPFGLYRVCALCLVNSTLGGLDFLWCSIRRCQQRVRSLDGFLGYSHGIAIGYGGFLFGAPLIGTLAHMMPLDRALLAVAVLVLLIAILASVARERGEASIKAKDETLA